MCGHRPRAPKLQTSRGKLRFYSQAGGLCNRESVAPAIAPMGADPYAVVTKSIWPREFREVDRTRGGSAEAMVHGG
jgi:hypothetical protein